VQKFLRRWSGHNYFDCEACGRFADRAHPNYHHIHDVDQLPRARTGAIERGFAVEIGGGIPTTWVKNGRSACPASSNGRLQDSPARGCQGTAALPPGFATSLEILLLCCLVDNMYTLWL